MTKCDPLGGTAHVPQPVALTRSDQAGWSLTTSELCLFAAANATTPVPLGDAGMAVAPLRMRNGRSRIVMPGDVGTYLAFTLCALMGAYMMWIARALICFLVSAIFGTHIADTTLYLLIGLLACASAMSPSSRPAASLAVKGKN